MKSNLTLSLLFTLLSLPKLYAQQISNVNFTEIYKNIGNPSSPYYYPVLLARYEKNDTTLTTAQYKHLYYGFTRQPTYNPYEKDENQKAFKQLIIDKNYQKAIEMGREGLRKSPFNMNYIFGIHFAFDHLDKRTEARQWLHKFEHLFEVIAQSGDGKKPQTAIVVITIGDEHIYLETVGHSVKKRELIDRYDKITLQEPNDLNQPELFFNIEKLGWHKQHNSIRKSTKDKY